MTDHPTTSGAFGDKTAAESASDKAVRSLVFSLLARGADSKTIQQALRRAGHHPGAWAVLRDKWEEDLVVREVPVQIRKIYTLKVAG